MKCKGCKHFIVDVEMQMKLGYCKKLDKVIDRLVKECKDHENNRS